MKRITKQDALAVRMKHPRAYRKRLVAKRLQDFYAKYKKVHGGLHCRTSYHWIALRAVDAENMMIATY